MVRYVTAFFLNLRHQYPIFLGISITQSNKVMTELVTQHQYQFARHRRRGRVRLMAGAP